MKRYLLRVVLSGFAWLAVASSQGFAAEPASRTAPVKAVESCESLSGLDLSDIGGKGSRVSRAAEGRRDGYAVCTVEGVLAPSIGFKVSLPLKGWTQRYLQVGCGGLCGNISEQIGAADGCTPLNAGGFVIGATDMGHQGMSGDFGKTPQLRADFAYRAQHLTAQAARKLIRTFYGQRLSYAYFSGCSDGGREALIEAQRYPGDFNGIIAGAAALNFQVQNGMYHAWQAAANTGQDGKPIVVAARLPLLHKAVLAQCDGLDGQVDGLISEPRLCHFDPAVLACKADAGNTSDCLTSAEVGAVRKFYEGPRDPATGERLTQGAPQPGSELAWAGVFIPFAADQPIFSAKIALDALLNLSFEKNPAANAGLSVMSFDKAGLDSLRPLHPFYDATNPDLTRFVAAGGKLILWHGWADPHISPLNTIAYHEALEKFLGKYRTESFERLYLLPGVYHCSGGEGPSKLDLLTAMMNWVENDQAPDAIVTQQAPADQGNGFGQPGGMPAGRPGQSGPVAGAGPKPGGAGGPAAGMPPMAIPPAASQPPASDAAGKAARTRPVYPYPARAVYSGKGNPDEAASYERAAPLFVGTAPVWAGSDFFKPYVAPAPDE